MKATFNNNLPRHNVSTQVIYKDGRAIRAVFHCPKCQMKREVNIATGKMNIVNHGDIGALHEGMTVPADAISMS